VVRSEPRPTATRIQHLFRPLTTAPTKPHIDTTGVSAGRVEGDIRQLSKLVRNLTDNASRHARSRVTLALRNGDGVVELTVEDDGDGIPLADRQRIFERFVRLEAARGRDTGGSGLGLAIVAEIATAHGASVSIEDSPDRGAKFLVRSPAV
jgi:signal transduction histidine kinase